jgi:hypothetical protein
MESVTQRVGQIGLACRTCQGHAAPGWWEIRSLGQIRSAKVHLQPIAV